MKVITAQTMQEIDRRAINECGIAGLTLMENAGRCCVDEIIAQFGVTGRAVIIAGKGNNGGDGYVIARLLAQRGWTVKVYVVTERDKIGGDAAINLEMLPDDIVEYCPGAGQLSAQFKDHITQTNVIVDALLGTGLQSNISGVFMEAITLMNSSGCPIVAVDIPSGIHGSTGKVLGVAVHATTTVTFAFAKLGHVLYPGAEYSGKLIITDIGIPPQLMESASGCDFLTPGAVRPLLHHRDRQAHKGQFGHCLMIAGSPGKTGAAALCANSALRAGSGLVTLAVAESLHHVLEIKTTEVMTVALPDTSHGHLGSTAFTAIEALLVGKNAMAIGPGLGIQSETTALVKNIVETVSLPLVIDADGLNALAEDIDVLRRKKSVTLIMTPHPGEMARLLGSSVPEVETNRLAVAQVFAKEFGVYLILKGARTVIAAPDGLLAINGSGNPGMASGGMGDVLTGIITSLLGQGYSGWDACRLGVFVHGYAADRVAEEKGEIGINASDVLEMLPYAYNRLLTSQGEITP